MSLYQTLIVEDNAVYRHAIRTIIDWEQCGFEVAAEAINGRQALELLEKSHFDLILTDVSMPEMNGIDLVQAVKERNSSVVIVMLSSYDDFQFVKDSLRLGAEDYLLKQELEPESLGRMLDQVKVKLERMNEKRIREEAKQSEDRAIRLKMWLTGETSSSKELEANLQEWVPHGEYELVLMARQESDGEGFDLSPYEDGRTIAIPIRSDRIVVLDADPLDRENGSGSAKGLARRWLHDAPRPDCRVAAFGVGRGNEGIHGLRSAYREADRALFRAVYEGWGRILAPDIRKNAEIANADQTRGWQAALRQDAPEALDHALNAIFETFRKTAPEKPIFIQRVVDLYGSLYGQAEDTSSSFDSRDWLAELTDDLDRLKPIENIHERLRSAIRQRFGDMQTPPVNRKEIKLALAYIREHYSKEITVADLSNHLGYSANYLSNLFRHETGLRVTEYVNRVRTEMAKRLLQDSQLKVYEVASRVGYPDVSYFCKVFKELTGETVTEFRRRG